MSEPTLFEVDDTLTVGQVNRRLGEAVHKAFPRDLWVQGQIRNLSRSGRGHVYFDLVDPVPAGTQPKSAIAVTLFDSNRQMVNRILTRTGNAVRIDDGVEVRIKAAIDYYLPRGQVQLNMLSIDPEFTLGRLSADRDRLLRELAADGLIDANAAVELPLVPLRVAVVTGHESAAQADFVRQIHASGYAFELTVLAPRVQGEFAPEEIAAAIVHAATLRVDAIAVVRGGGARTDLAAFDTEPVARAIACSPLPVVCGIGHEIDSSVADTVAHASFKTPTACAQFLVERVIAFDFAVAERAARVAALAQLAPQVHLARIDDHARKTVDSATRALATAQARNAQAGTGLHRRVSRALGRTDQRLAAASARVESAARRAITSASRRCGERVDRLVDLQSRSLRAEAQRLDLCAAKLSAVDPVQALRRGYTITTVADGGLLRSAAGVAPGSVLVTRLADGTVTSTTTDSKTAEDLA